MEPFDKRLKERAKQEPFPLPETYAGKVRDTCAALKETNMKENKQKRSYRWLVGVAAALAVFVAIPNVSPAAAAAMEEIPVLGAVVRVITFRDYQYDDGHNTADVQVPELGGSSAADAVNDQVQAFTDQLIAQFQADCEATGEGYQGLDITSSVVTDSDTWFTLRIDATKVKASGYDLTRFYHIDKATGEVKVSAASKLAEVAVETAKTAKLFGIDPKVAVLSFSTKGSGKGGTVALSHDAVIKAQEMDPELAVDGELQFDAAVAPEVAQVKCKGSKVAGQANTFIFPCIEAGNIGYKIAQRLGGYAAYGPILQGLNAPINDLSRGCNADEVYKMSLITACQS